MKKIPTQITLQEVDEDYKAFVDKFKPKKTTDDCYTPENIYKVVLNWVCRRYGINAENVVRPFWPGGDYMRFPYKSNSVVVDNPPFSILSQIVAFYLEHDVPFFLFAPTLTNFGTGLSVCHVIISAQVTYENGAVVDTSFLTNMENLLVLADPELAESIKAEDEKNRRANTKSLPKYEYPDNVVTAAMVRYIVSHGVKYTLEKRDAFHIRKLDSQTAAGKAIFGSGFLLSEKAAAEKAAAHVWQLSDREKEIIKTLGAKEEP